MMKIAIIGAHRVGKTTLAEKLQEALPQFELYQEPYHELEELGYTFSDEPQIDDFLAQFKHAIKQLSTATNAVIFDRCPIDLLAYIKVLGGDHLFSSQFNTIENTIKSIDLLVFVPIEHTPEYASSEFDFAELRHQVNDFIGEWMVDLEMETLVVNGNLSNRLNQVVQKINLLQL